MLEFPPPELPPPKHLRFEDLEPLFEKKPGCVSNKILYKMHQTEHIFRCTTREYWHFLLI